jgi:arylsulfatase A-like enzyme
MEPPPRARTIAPDRVLFFSPVGRTLVHRNPPAPRRCLRTVAGRRAIAVLGLVILTGCGSSPSSPPNLVLIVIDTLRADHLGTYGYERATSPHIDRLAERGLVFANALTTSSWTKPSVASLFTSRYPSEHGAVSFERNLSSKLPTLAEMLREAGYRTVGVSGNFVHVAERTGFARGFDAFESLVFEVERPGGEMLLAMPGEDGELDYLRAPTGSEVNRRVLDLLPDPDSAPVFVYVHYMEPHPGYSPSEPQRSAFVTDSAAHARGAPATAGYLSDLAASAADLEPAERQRLVDLYDAEIAAVDEAVGELLRELEDGGYMENTVVAVTSDHGEEFGEHGGWFHGLTLNRECLQVPIVFHDTRKRGSGERRQDPVDLLDLPTTLLALAGVAPPPSMRGRDLLAPEPPARDLVAELHRDPVFEDRVRPRVQKLALVRWPWKAIVHVDGTRSFYRLDRDPEELHPLPGGGNEVPGELLAALSDLEDSLTRAEPASEARPVDPETRAGLRALGYAD